MVKLNKFYLFDNLKVLSNIPDNFIDLIYIDPPFFTQKNWDKFNDKWDSIDNYLKFMGLRIKEIYRVLKSIGSFYLHCFTPDSKILMDNFLFKRIDQVEVGEKVFTGSSKTEEIEKVWVHNYNGIIKEIRCMGQYVTIKSTPNHLFYVVKKEIRDLCKRRYGRIKLNLISSSIQKIRADELKIGDMLLIPKNVNNKNIISYIKTTELIQTKTSNIRKNKVKL